MSSGVYYWGGSRGRKCFVDNCQGKSINPIVPLLSSNNLNTCGIIITAHTENASNYAAWRVWNLIMPLGQSGRLQAVHTQIIGF
jgi:hypothetical protein